MRKRPVKGSFCYFGGKEINQGRMMKIWGMFAVALSVFSSGTNAETLVYKGVPLPLPVTVGVETTLLLEEPHMIGRTKGSKEWLTLVSEGNQIHINASEQGEEKVFLRGINTGRVIALNLHAGQFERITDSVITVRTADFSSPTKSDSGAESSSTKIEHQKKVALDSNERTALLVRYISQQYGPKEAREPIPFGVTITNGNIGQEVKGLYRGAAVKFVLQEVYQGGGLTGLLFEVENISRNPISIDPSSIRGRFIAAHPWKWHLKSGERGVVVLVNSGGPSQGMLKAIARSAHE
ncbi:TPA: DUF3438 family protein [Vibrio vulnificus]|nr:DUF3438 family protein [Vibrio vulnificus]